MVELCLGKRGQQLNFLGLQLHLQGISPDITILKLGFEVLSNSWNRALHKLDYTLLFQVEFLHVSSRYLFIRYRVLKSPYILI